MLAHHRITNLKSYWPFGPIQANIPDYRLSYHPKSKLDSIAFIAFKDPEQFLNDMRLELAREYRSKGNHYAAYKEFEAMLRSNPYLAANYRDAASSLINLGHLPLALRYFIKSLEYEQSYYATYRIGEIYLIKGDYVNAIRSFEEAFSITLQNSDKMKAIEQQLKKYNAGQYLKIPPKRYNYDKYIPYKTENQVTAAAQMISEGKYPEALSSLEASLKIFDSHIAHRYMGEIYLQLGNNTKALYHLNRVYSEFSFDPEFLTDLIFLYKFHG